MEKHYGKMVLITTERRGVFVGVLANYDRVRRAAILSSARMVIYWGTTGGVLELASTGPTAKSRVSPVVTAEVMFELVECVAVLSEAATSAWAAYAK